MSILLKDSLSEKEREMYKILGFEYLFSSPCQSFGPQDLLRVAVAKAFEDNLQGPAVESLRRCAKAFSGSKVYRLTEEWDQLIIL